MRIWKMVIAMMMVCVLMAGCGATNTAQAPATAETAAPATASTEQVQTTTSAEQAQAAEVSTSAVDATQAPATGTAEQATEAKEFPIYQTTVVWLEEGKVLSIEEYKDKILVVSAEGTEEFPLSLPHLEEEELLFTELPAEWQDALSK